MHDNVAAPAAAPAQAMPAVAPAHVPIHRHRCLHEAIDAAMSVLNLFKTLVIDLFLTVAFSLFLSVVPMPTPSIIGFVDVFCCVVVAAVKFDASVI